MYPVVEVQGLVNRFGTQLVHDGLDMEVHADEVFGIVGGSGTGKSVLLRTILGLQRPVAGTVRINGSDITRLSEAELRSVKSRYGVSFQAGALYSGLTVRENVQLPMLEYLSLNPRALDDLALLKIRLVGLPAEAAGKYPAQLSGGMIKRAALARALALDPKLLFLDVRMDATAELLARGSLTVRDVAQRVGYRQPAQFAKAFRRHHGVSPSSLSRPPPARRTPPARPPIARRRLSGPPHPNPHVTQPTGM